MNYPDKLTNATKMHQIEYIFSKFSRGYRPGGGVLGGPQNYTHVMNYPDKLTNASKCTKLDIDFQNVFGGDTPEPACLSGKEGAHLSG